MEEKQYVIMQTFADGWIENEQIVTKEYFNALLDLAAARYPNMPCLWADAWFYIPNPDNEPFGIAFLIREI